MLPKNTWSRGYWTPQHKQNKKSKRYYRQNSRDCTECFPDNSVHIATHTVSPPSTTRSERPLPALARGSRHKSGSAMHLCQSNHLGKNRTKMVRAICIPITVPVRRQQSQTAKSRHSTGSTNSYSLQILCHLAECRRYLHPRSPISRGRIPTNASKP